MKRRLIFISIILLTALYGTCHGQCTVSTSPTICPPGDIVCLTPQMLACQNSKYNLPYGVQLGAKATYTSFLKGLDTVNHPKGVFAQNAALGGLLSTFITSLENDPSFLPYFNKLHIIILHQLYLYLTKIYINFNMSHIDTIDQYLTNYATQAQNRKTLIINHLINIIEAQANQAFIGLFPTFPQNMASVAGNLLLQNDYGADLNLLLEEFEETLLVCPDTANLITPLVKGSSTSPGLRNQYLAYIGQYLKLFNAYLAVLASDVKTFIQYAQTIQTAITNVMPAKPTIGYSESITDQFKQSMATLRSQQFINPPLFFYDAETMRGIKVITQVAASLPKATSSVPWPATLVSDAQKQNPLQNKWGQNVYTCICGVGQVLVYPAFFTDSNNTITQSAASAKHLYVNIPTMEGVYTQEVLAQPAWMNSQQGIIAMVRACLGDFAALFSPELYQEPILDPCLYCILGNAVQAAGIPANTNPTACPACTNFITNLKQYAPTISCAPTGSTTPTVPGISDGTTPPLPPPPSDLSSQGSPS